MISAAIDVGATSVHLLVAAVGATAWSRCSTSPCSWASATASPRMAAWAPMRREELVAALVAYADTARQLGARTDHGRRHGAAAARRRRGGGRLAVEARTGVPLHVLDHEEEGLLMLLGVTKGRPIVSNLLVVDVGGGSTEFVVVGPAGEVHATGLPLGPRG